MSPARKTRCTPEQYLAIERAAEFRSEFYRGEMFAIVGASRKHNLIRGNVFGELRQQFKGRECEVYQSDMKQNDNCRDEQYQHQDLTTSQLQNILRLKRQVMPTLSGGL